jgi:hypothetical protein
LYRYRYEIDLVYRYRYIRAQKNALMVTGSVADPDPVGTASFGRIRILGYKIYVYYGTFLGAEKYCE